MRSTASRDTRGAKDGYNLTVRTSEAWRVQVGKYVEGVARGQLGLSAGGHSARGPRQRGTYGKAPAL
jgi:hypothetical protein